MEYIDELQAPFKEDEYEWRVQSAYITQDKASALVLCYVTNRAIMDRLDNVFGIDRWQNTYRDIGNGAVECGISVHFDATGWVTKFDAAEETDIEKTKGGRSNAMKRAAVQWGIGRLLYKLDAFWVNLDKSKGTHKHQHFDKKTNTRYYWSPPKLPEWAVSERCKSVKQDTVNNKSTGSESDVKEFFELKTGLWESAKKDYNGIEQDALDYLDNIAGGVGLGNMQNIKTVDDIKKVIDAYEKNKNKSD